MLARKRQEGPIIRNTTTCPYCGHRVKHENLNAHIQDQHPDDAQLESFAKQLERTSSNSQLRVWRFQKSQDQNSLIKCPECNSKVAPKNLARHLRKQHGKLEEQVRKVKNREQAQFPTNVIISTPVFTPTADFVSCPICGANVKPKNVGKHFRRSHPPVLPPGK